MTLHKHTLLFASLLPLALIAVATPAFGHNGRDAGNKRPSSKHSGIEVTVDPVTGVRTYTQVGPVAPNPALSNVSPVRGDLGPGIDYWATLPSGGGGYVPMKPGYSEGYVASPSHESNSSSDSYQDYGYYYPVWPVYDYGRPGRPGHGGGGRPEPPGGDRPDPPRSGNGGYNLQPGSAWSPPLANGIGGPTPRPPGMVTRDSREVEPRGGGRRR